MPKDTLAYDDVAERIDFSVVTGADLSVARDSERKQDAVSRLMKAWENKNAQRAAKGLGLTMVAVSLAACGTEAEPTPEPVPVPPAPPANLTLSLTVGPNDNLIGGEGNDTFVGALAGDPVTGTQTWQVTDVISGGAGNDTLVATIRAAAVDYDTAALAANLSGVENLVLTSVDLASTVTLGGAGFGVAGITSVTNTGSLANLTVTQLGNIVDVNVINTALATTVTFKDAVLAGTNDSVNLNVNGATGAITLNTVTGAAGGTGIETLNINATGSASNFAASGISADVTALNIAGAGNLTLTGAAFPKLATLNASTATGNISVVVAADTVPAATNTKSFTFGSGNDTLDISAIDPTTVGAVTVNMGAGDDTVILGARGASDYAINGGAGMDTVSISVNASASLHQNISGFERLTVTGLATDHDMVQFINNLGFTHLRAENGGAAITFTNVGAAVTTLELLKTAGDVTVTRLDPASTTDSLAIVARAGAPVIVGTLAIANEETVSINASANAFTATAVTAGDMTSLTVTGSNVVAVGTVTGEKVATVDVSGLGGAFTGVFTSSTANMTVTGNANADAGIMTITTGSGNDVITGGRLGDTIVSGAGNDVIRGGRGDDTINIGTGSNTLIFEASAVANGIDAITGFNGGATTAGGDVLNVNLFLGGGSIANIVGTGGAITVFTTGTSTDDVAIAGKLAVLVDAGATTDVLAADAVFAAIDRSGDAFSIAPGGKAVVIVGVVGGATSFVVFVDTASTGTTGLERTDVSTVASFATALDVDTLVSANFIL